MKSLAFPIAAVAATPTQPAFRAMDDGVPYGSPASVSQLSPDTFCGTSGAALALRPPLVFQCADLHISVPLAERPVTADSTPDALALGVVRAIRILAQPAALPIQLHSHFYNTKKARMNRATPRIGRTRVTRFGEIFSRSFQTA